MSAKFGHLEGRLTLTIGGNPGTYRWATGFAEEPCVELAA